MRLVTLTDHPDNIAVYTAASMSEALLKADDAFRHTGIQGAVWFSQSPSVTWDKEVRLLDHYKKVLGQQDAPARRLDIVVVSKTTQEKRQTIGFGYSGRTIHDPQMLDPDRLENLSILTANFDRARLSIRHEKNGEAVVHYDGTGKESVPFSDNSLFRGQEVRILHSRSVAGTWVYDLKGHDLEEAGALPAQPWEVGTGNCLFLVGLDGRREKALPHSTPQFELAPTVVTPRIVDVYDCRAM